MTVDSSNGCSSTEGFIDGAKKDKQSITADWLPLQELIESVRVYEVKSVLKAGAGRLTEIFRRDWGLDDGVVDQVFQNMLEPGQISGWHMHQKTTDRIFVNYGHLWITLYDARSGSDSYGRINTFSFGDSRSALVTIPPGVWHAVANLGSRKAILLNLVDQAYSYEDPDHWRLPIDTDKIPYRFDKSDRKEASAP